MTGQNRSQCQPANHNQRKQPQLHRPAMNKYLARAHREPDQQRQNRIQPESYWEAALQIRDCQLRMRALQSLAFIRLRIIGLSTVSQASPSQQWCTGEDSNLRSSKERQIYSLLPLTARPPVHSRRPLAPGLRKKVLTHTAHSADAFPRRNLEGSFTSGWNECGGIFRAGLKAISSVRLPARAVSANGAMELAKGLEPPTV